MTAITRHSSAIRCGCVLAIATAAVAAPTGAQSQAGSPLGPVAGMTLTVAQEVRLAESAAPDSVARAAGVFVYGPSGYIRQRVSRNGFECIVNRDSWIDGYDALKPTCYDREGARTILPVLLRIGELTAQRVRADSIGREINRSFATGVFSRPAHTGVAYMLQGDIAAYDAAAGTVKVRAFPPHLMLYAPGVRQEDLGITEHAAGADPRLPMIYSRGPNFGYIVVRVPDTPR
jgi:hypothetical protein